MCDHHDHSHDVPGSLGPGPSTPRRDPSRRSVLHGSALAALALALPHGGRSTGALRSGALRAGATDPAVRMALHVHASFSEGGAGMDSQLECARRNAVDVVWFTEHDWRMSQHCYRTAASFDGPTDGEEFGRRLRWTPVSFGDPASTDGGFVDTPVSPLDPSPVDGALRAAVTASSSSDEDSYLYYCDPENSRQNYRGNATGTTISLEVFPRRVETDGWGELRIQLSNHAATGERDEGRYFLSYRFGAAGPARAEGYLGIVPVAAPTNRWSTVHVDPVADVARLWPDLVAEDNAICALYVGAGARRGASAEVIFDYLRFSRDQPVQLSPFDVQNRILAGYADLYRDITAHTGQEVSFLPDHLGWLGGDDHLIDYTGVRLANKQDSEDSNARARALAARGGQIAINHPFGAEAPGRVPPVTTSQISALAAQYLSYGAYGATMLEVGYATRGGATLEQHLTLWDTLSRNGIYLTGTGVNDDHSGLGTKGSRPWLSSVNRYTTSVWAGSTSEQDLLRQLGSGRSFSSELSAGDVAISVSAAGAPMGSVSVSRTGSRRDVVVEADALPTGGSVSVVRGVVDYAGTDDLTPGSRVVEQLSTRDLSSGARTVSVDTTESCFVRTLVRDSSGRGVALSNPVWLLREPSRTPVPALRRAAG